MEMFCPKPEDGGPHNRKAVTFYSPFAPEKNSKGRLCFKAEIKEPIDKAWIQEQEKIIKELLEDKLGEEGWTWIPQWRRINPKFAPLLNINQLWRGNKCKTDVWIKGSPWSLGWQKRKFTGKADLEVKGWLNRDKKIYSSLWITAKINILAS